MSYILNEYIIFILKILTVLIVPIVFIILIKIKKTNKSSQIIIKNVNEHFNLLKEYTYKKINTKKTYKEKSKTLKTSINIFKKNIQSNLFIINFNGDVNATETRQLKDIISLIILTANENDEVLLKLNSNGGFVNSYGLAATQLQRLKNKNINLTISIDLVAASGGYLMASVANQIIAAPFAIIGSIGVIGIVPNFNKLLEKHNIEIEHHTAGEYKSTLNIFSKNTDNGRKKFIETLEQTHTLFKNFITENRKNIDTQKVCTGEYWYAKDALNLNLIDKIQTCDDYILESLYKKNIYEINIKETTLKNKLGENIKSMIINLFKTL